MDLTLTLVVFPTILELPLAIPEELFPTERK